MYFWFHSRIKIVQKHNFVFLRLTFVTGMKFTYFIEYGAHFCYIANDDEIFLAHYTWKSAEKWF